jgi:hypothetical protein
MSSILLETLYLGTGILRHDPQCADHAGRRLGESLLDCQHYGGAMKPFLPSVGQPRGERRRWQVSCRRW